MTQQTNKHSVEESSMEKSNYADLNQMIEEYRRITTGRIKFLMRKRHIGQEELASLMGIKQSHISRIVSGKMNVTIDILIKMLYYLDASIDFEDNKEKSISVFWKDYKKIKENFKAHNQRCREKYTLKYINSSPTLVMA